MSLHPENLDGVEKQKAAPQVSYEMQITSCRLTETGGNSNHSGLPMLKLSLEYAYGEDLRTITHYISLPYKGDDKASFKLQMLKRFLSLFNVPYNNDLEQLCFSMIGAITRVVVTVVEREGNTYHQLKIPSPAE